VCHVHGWTRRVRFATHAQEAHECAPAARRQAHRLVQRRTTEVERRVDHGSQCWARPALTLHVYAERERHREAVTGGVQLCGQVVPSRGLFIWAHMLEGGGGGTLRHVSVLP